MCEETIDIARTDPGSYSEGEGGGDGITKCKYLLIIISSLMLFLIFFKLFLLLYCFIIFTIIIITTIAIYIVGEIFI